MKFIVILTTLFALTGCAAGQTSNCSYRNLIGKNVYSGEVEAIRQSGKEVRLLYPDSFIGFSRQENRVNLTRDDNDEIVSVSCG